MKCLLCQSENHEIFKKAESFGFPLVYYQCQNCGLIYQSAEESRAADPDFYAETYRKIYQNRVSPTAKDLFVQEKRAAYLVKVIQRCAHLVPKRILDIGASAGLLLEYLRHFYGCEGVGVEPGDAYRAFAAAKGLTMVDSLETLINQNSPPFDLVSMAHVLEHLPNPVATLQQIRTHLLTDDGLLVVEVPNFYAHDSYELAHLACYTSHSLMQTLQKAGFQVKALRRHGYPRSRMLNLYITVLAQPLRAEEVPQPVIPERLVRFKRWLGLIYRRFVQKLFPHQAWLPLPTDVKK